MRTALGVLVVVLWLPAAATSAWAQALPPYARAVRALNARADAMLAEIARRNEARQPSLLEGKAKLPTIVKLRVTSGMRSQLRAELTDRTERSIDAHRSACRADTATYAMNAPAPNPVNQNVAETYVDFPVSTLLGRGNLVRTTYANGIVDACGRR